MPRATDLAIGFLGLAVLRAWPDTDAAAIDAALDALRDDPDSAEVVIAPHTVEGGYSRWAASYDGPGNPIFAIEEAVVRPLLAALPAGTVLDAACGTGRHAAFLAESGHQVTGVDITAAMLDRARVRVPSGHFEVGRLDALPVPDAAFDATICTLALSHCPDLTVPIAEIARATRPGGSIILADIHPSNASLGGTAKFTDSDGTTGTIPEYIHWHGEYIAAITAAGCTITACHDIPYTADALSQSRRDRWANGLASHALVGLPAVLVWELRR